MKTVFLVVAAGIPLSDQANSESCHSFEPTVGEHKNSKTVEDVVVPWRESNHVAVDLITQHIRSKLGAWLWLVMAFGEWTSGWVLFKDPHANLHDNMHIIGNCL